MVNEHAHLSIIYVLYLISGYTTAVSMYCWHYTQVYQHCQDDIVDKKLTTIDVRLCM